jgi:hypothetical protein
MEVFAFFGRDKIQNKASPRIYIHKHFRNKYRPSSRFFITPIKVFSHIFIELQTENHLTHIHNQLIFHYPSDRINDMLRIPMNHGAKNKTGKQCNNNRSLF